MTVHRNGKAIRANVRTLKKGLWGAWQNRVTIAGLARREPTVLPVKMYVVANAHAVATGGKVAVGRRDVKMFLVYLLVFYDESLMSFMKVNVFGCLEVMLPWVLLDGRNLYKSH